MWKNIYKVESICVALNSITPCTLMNNSLYILVKYKVYEQKQGSTQLILGPIFFTNTSFLDTILNSIVNTRIQGRP